MENHAVFLKCCNNSNVVITPTFYIFDICFPGDPERCEPFPDFEDPMYSVFF